MSDPTTTPFGGIVLERYEGQAIPAGCVVYSDVNGSDWLVFAPDLRQDMACSCPHCDA